MIQLIPQLRILIASQLTYFRNGIEWLAALCNHQFAKDPISGILFDFHTFKRFH